jgi:hypothetical protein
MKYKINKEKNTFEPFTVKITVQSVEEARSLYHIFNHTNLGEIMRNYWYDMDEYSNNFSDNLCIEDLSEDIKNIV